jgi:uncharacterized membrane protein
MKKVSLIFAAILFNILVSCEYNHLQPTCDVQNVSFSKQVLPIITARCATLTCHSPANASSLLTISNYHQIRQDCTDVSSYIKSKKMPVGDPLSDCEYAIITAWFKQGAKDN